MRAILLDRGPRSGEPVREAAMAETLFRASVAVALAAALGLGTLVLSDAAGPRFGLHPDLGPVDGVLRALR
jgi:hypothetical protein